VLSYLWVAARNDQLSRERDSLPKVERNTTVKRDQILKLLRQTQRQRKTRAVRNLSVRVAVDGLVNAARQHARDGTVRMEQKHIIFTLATMIVVGVVASYGMVIQKWVDWTTTTLVDLDKRTAIMGAEMKHTNDMVSQNYEMLKVLMERVQKVSYDDQPGKPETTDIKWTE
jgi:hypothetical protein